MKYIINVLLAVAVVMGLYSCNDETIGSSINDTYLSVIQDSSFAIDGQSSANYSLLSRTSIQLLGTIKSEGYGTLSSQIVSQFMPVYAVDTAGTKLDWIDSCKMILRLPSTGAFTGDSLAPMRLNVYALNKQLPSPIYSDFDPSGYYSEDDLMGSAPYSYNSAKLVSEYDANTYSYIYHREVEVPMAVDYAKNIFQKFVDSPETFKSPKAFAEYFPGVVITNSFGSGRVMNFTDIELRTYYRKYMALSDTTDTIYPAMTQTYLASSPEVVLNNIIKLDVDPAVKECVDKGDVIVMAPAGYEVKAHFPVQEIIDNYKAASKGAMSVINALTMEIPAEKITNKYDIAPPKYLLMVKTCKKDEFIMGDSLANNKDSFYAAYDATTDSYQFTSLREYVLDIIRNKGGVATEDDMNFTITPMDVTVYTDSSSSYYYYYYGTDATSTETITKIAPQVSCPAIARLRLDKASVKLTFSKQSML